MLLVASNQGIIHHLPDRSYFSCLALGWTLERRPLSGPESMQADRPGTNRSSFPRCVTSRDDSFTEDKTGGSPTRATVSQVRLRPKSLLSTR